MDISSARRHFSIYLADGYSMLSFSAFVGAVRSVNRSLGQTVYTWDVLSHEAGPISSDSDAQVVTLHGSPNEFDHHRGGGARTNVLLSVPKDVGYQQKLVAWVREGLARGVRVISMGEATMLLAGNGLLAGKRCAVHWKDFGIAVDRFPQVHITRTFYEIDGGLHTCAGEMAMFDLILLLAEKDFGRDASERAGVLALHARPRNPSERQQLPSHVKLERSRSPILTIVDHMEDNVGDPLDINEIIGKVSISRRQIERLFERDMRMSPKRYYLKLRLERARDLLVHSSMPIVDVAIATGFISASHFAKTFKTLFGFTPSDARRGDLSLGGGLDAHGHFSNNDNGLPGLVVDRLGQWAAK